MIDFIGGFMVGILLIYVYRFNFHGVNSKWYLENFPSKVIKLVNCKKID